MKFNWCDKNKMKFALIISLFVLVFTGCTASSHMKQYVAKDIREIIIDSGQPENAFDLGDGRRVFQFRWGGGSYVVPQTTSYTGNINTIGNNTWLSGKAITTGGGIVTSEGCLLSYIAKWNENRNGWIVDEIRVPKQLVC